MEKGERTNQNLVNKPRTRKTEMKPREKAQITHTQRRPTRSYSNRVRKELKEEVVFKKSPLKIIPLGGLLEIGKNITVFEYEDDIIIVDCGLAFPEDEMLGIDLVIPDISYLEKNKDKIRGLVIRSHRSCTIFIKTNRCTNICNTTNSWIN